MLLNVTYVANHIQSLDQVGICLYRNVDRLCDAEPSVSEFSIMEAKLLEIFYQQKILCIKNGFSQSLDVGQKCADTTTSDLQSDKSHFEML